VADREVLALFFSESAKPMYMHRRPESEMQALMESTAAHPIEDSIEMLLPLRDVIEDALDLLDPKHRFVVNALVIEGMSLSQCAVFLAAEIGRDHAYSKTRIARIRDEAFAALRTVLSDRPEIKERLSR
jgi:hypothetical protein